jgi:ribonuclease HI
MNISTKQIIYTDGSCIPNPGPGGYGFVILEYDGKELTREWHVSGGENPATNNRMELRAVIEALKFTHTKEEYVIYSDSMYVINCAKGKWARKKNTKMWSEYERVSKDKNIEWVWVKGHSGDKYNEIVDRLAKKEAKNEN